jgi:hypothetical protein
MPEETIPKPTVHYSKQYDIVYQNFDPDDHNSVKSIGKWNGKWQVDWWEGDVQYGAAGDTKEEALKNALESKSQGLCIAREYNDEIYARSPSLAYH